MKMIDRLQTENIVKDLAQRFHLAETEELVLKNKLLQFQTFEQASNFSYQNLYLLKRPAFLDFLGAQQTTQLDQEQLARVAPIVENQPVKSKTMVLSKNRAAFINEMFLATITGVGLGVTLVCAIKIMMVI